MFVCEQTKQVVLTEKIRCSLMKRINKRIEKYEGGSILLQRYQACTNPLARGPGPAYYCFGLVKIYQRWSDGLWPSLG